MGKYIRNNDDVDKYNIGSMIKSDFGAITLKGTTPAATAAIPQVSATVQEFTPVMRDTTVSTVVCSGTVLLIGDTYGVLANDTPVSTANSTYLTNIETLMLLHGSASVTVGGDAYIEAATGLVTHDAALPAVYIGYFTGASETNPDGLPAGDYAPVQLRQGEK